MTAIGLNPSTADAERDDRTTSRLMQFAAAAGCNRLILVNLFAWRATAPGDLPLRSAVDPVGLDNDAWLRGAIAEADVVVAAWGGHASAAHRATAVLDLARHQIVWCLGRTRQGAPRHPLYVRNGTPFTRYRSARHDWSEWEQVPDPGVTEQLRERACVCGADEVDIDPTRWNEAA